MVEITPTERRKAAEQISTVPRTLVANTSGLPDKGGVVAEDSSPKLRGVPAAVGEVTPQVEITTVHRKKAAEIIQSHWNTLKMPDVCRMLGISTAYGYSIIRGLKHYNGTWHCPEKWIRVVLAFGEAK